MPTSIDLEAPPVTAEAHLTTTWALMKVQRQYDLHRITAINTIGLWRDRRADFANAMATGNDERRRLTYVIQRHAGTRALGRSMTGNRTSHLQAWAGHSCSAGIHR